MASKYLDGTGLAYLWEKLKGFFATKTELNAKADAADIPQYVICTLSAYNAMASHDAGTYYIIISENNAQS